MLNLNKTCSESQHLDVEGNLDAKIPFSLINSIFDIFKNRPLGRASFPPSSQYRVFQSSDIWRLSWRRTV